MDTQAFKQVMATLAETYSKNVTPLTAKMYWQALKEFSNEEVEQAAMDYISDPQVCQFWPQPGALIAKITGTAKQRELSTTDAALQAWDYIVKQIQNIGAYGRLEMDDGVALKAVISIGGWRELCH